MTAAEARYHRHVRVLIFVTIAQAALAFMGIG